VFIIGPGLADETSGRASIAIGSISRSAAMDWMIIGAAVIGGWAMLSVFSSERIARAQLVAIARSKAAERDRDAEVPIALSNEGALHGSASAFNRKR
jgi:hypothetical protein